LKRLIQDSNFNFTNFTKKEPTMKTSLRATLAATALAIASIANLASLPSAALTVAAGLVVSGDVLAANKDIPGIGIRVRKNPGGTARTAPLQSGPDGSFHLTGLEPGDYEVTPDGGKAAIFKVGADGKLSGVVRTGGVVQTSGGAGPVTGKIAVGSVNGDGGHK
jgi:hypothetical protein